MHNNEQDRISPISRRSFIATAVAGLTIASVAASPLKHLQGGPIKIKAIAFDAFPIFDPRPVFGLVNQLFPEKGIELAETWRTRQFEYTWLRTAGGIFKDFGAVTEDALVFAANKTGVNLTTAYRRQLMDQYLALNVWPDVLPALETLKRSGIRLAFLSNMTGEMLKSCSRHAKVDGYFEHLISTERAKTYKPSPVAYQLGVDALKLKKEEILFAAFAGWDASGAKWFGYPTFWVNRLGGTPERLDGEIIAIGRDLAALDQLILEHG